MQGVCTIFTLVVTDAFPGLLADIPVYAVATDAFLTNANEITFMQMKFFFFRFHKRIRERNWYTVI